MTEMTGGDYGFPRKSRARAIKKTGRGGNGGISFGGNFVARGARHIDKFGGAFRNNGSFSRSVRLGQTS